MQCSFTSEDAGAHILTLEGALMPNNILCPKQPAHAVSRIPVAAHPLPMLLPLLSLHVALEGQSFVTCAIVSEGTKPSIVFCGEQAETWTCTAGRL